MENEAGLPTAVGQIRKFFSFLKMNEKFRYLIVLIVFGRRLPRTRRPTKNLKNLSSHVQYKVLV
jgi:hypothetical protein